MTLPITDRVINSGKENITWFSPFNFDFGIDYFLEALHSFIEREWLILALSILAGASEATYDTLVINLVIAKALAGAGSVGIAPIKTTSGLIRKHHSFPKYLGGAGKQDLIPLSKKLHDAYHSGLDKILPRQKGTSFYQNLSEEELMQIYKDLADYTKAFDAKYGTSLFEAMIKEGFLIP